MSRYYASSKLFKWLREKVFKVKKPTALPFGQWDMWEKEFKTSRPWAHFFTETLPDALEIIPRFFVDPILNIRYSLYCKYGLETHKLRTTLKPGVWYDTDTRLMNACFTALVDYVEVELAHRTIMFEDKADRKKYNVPFWARHQLFKLTPFRCKQAGLDHLKWASELDDTPGGGVGGQADGAIEVSILYFWWTQARITSDQAWTISGLDKFWAAKDAEYGENWLFASGGLGGTPNKNVSAADIAEYHRLSAEVDRIENECHQIDDDMLIRLIKIRRELWT